MNLLFCEYILYKLTLPRLGLIYMISINKNIYSYNNNLTIKLLVCKTPVKLQLTYF